MAVMAPMRLRVNLLSTRDAGTGMPRHFSEPSASAQVPAPAPAPSSTDRHVAPHLDPDINNSVSPGSICKAGGGRPGPLRWRGTRQFGGGFAVRPRALIPLYIPHSQLVQLLLAGWSGGAQEDEAVEYGFPGQSPRRDVHLQGRPLRSVRGGTGWSLWVIR